MTLVLFGTVLAQVEVYAVYTNADKISMKGENAMTKKILAFAMLLTMTFVALPQSATAQLWEGPTDPRPTKIEKPQPTETTTDLFASMLSVIDTMMSY
ncbi:MAG: hypothetical protein DMF63_13290 [Acidobacteria bacterium]|nr:MAG: hypothetical protein DMF63_13290 [Acidobacteriota bacterium]